MTTDTSLFFKETSNNTCHFKILELFLIAVGELDVQERLKIKKARRQQENKNEVEDNCEEDVNIEGVLPIGEGSLIL